MSGGARDPSDEEVATGCAPVLLILFAPLAILAVLFIVLFALAMGLGYSQSQDPSHGNFESNSCGGGSQEDVREGGGDFEGQCAPLTEEETVTLLAGGDGEGAWTGSGEFIVAAAEKQPTEYG